MSENRDQNKFVVRLPEGMRERIAAAAKQNNRSMNAEIVSRLESTFSGHVIDPIQYWKEKNDHEDELRDALDSIIKKKVDKYIYEALRQSGEKDLFDKGNK